MNARPITVERDNDEWMLKLVSKGIASGSLYYITSKMHMITQAEENGYVSTVALPMYQKIVYDYCGPFYSLDIIRRIKETYGEKFEAMILY